MHPPHEAPAGTPAARDRSLALPWLVADVGGTNARFGWVADPARGVEHLRTLPTAAHAGPAEAAAAYLAELRATLGDAGLAPRRAALALATAIEGDTIHLTNAAWRFSRQALQAALGVETLTLLNDFEALALALPRLRDTQWRPVGPVIRGQGPMAVIGPGTGLGVAGIVPTPRGWVALPSEGGHATLAPFDDFESALLQHVRRSHEHVSAERLLSGIGLPQLHEAVAAVLGQPVPRLSTELIVERGLARSDALCSQTIDSFCALLGGFAGNVALTLGARGGVCIGGGIVPRFGERFLASAFRERFEAKGRFRAYLQGIPTMLITDTLVALSGAAFALEQPGG